MKRMDVNASMLANAFGEPPQRFQERVRCTVRRLEGERQARPRLRAAMVLAAALILLVGAALALSSLGVLDILAENLRRHLLPGAEELVQGRPEQSGMQPNGAIFTIEEAIHDGRQLYLMVRVTAADQSSALLMDYNAEPAWGKDWWLFHDEDAGESFSARASQTGRSLIQVNCPSLTLEGQELEKYTSTVQYDGEDVLYAFTFQGITGDFHGTLSLFANNLYGQGETRSFGQLTFTLPLRAESAVYTADTPLPLPAMGGTLYALALEQTPIATYLRLEYGPGADATDLQLLHLRDGLWCRWLDDQGEPIPEGNSLSSLEEREGRVVLETAYRAFEALPREITLEFYNGMTKERFDTVTLALTKERSPS